MKRFFDILFSLLLLIVLAPMIIIIAVLILVDSSGAPIFMQERVGKGEQIFTIYKFRTMIKEQDEKSSLLTIGDKDNRITKVGFWLRKYKLDELPQLWNVLSGSMSVVGPRPEVKEFVKHYTTEQMRIFQVRPGLTDYASIMYAEESKLLAEAPDAERFYLEKIMPHKLKLNLDYLESRSLSKDIGIIFKTVGRIIRIR